MIASLQAPIIKFQLPTNDQLCNARIGSLGFGDCLVIGIWDLVITTGGRSC